MLYDEKPSRWGDDGDDIHAAHKRAEVSAMAYLTRIGGVVTTPRDVEVMVLRAAAVIAGKYNEGMSQELLEDTADAVEALHHSVSAPADTTNPSTE